jgi:hypothetical protein
LGGDHCLGEVGRGGTLGHLDAGRAGSAEDVEQASDSNIDGVSAAWIAA